MKKPTHGGKRQNAGRPKETAESQSMKKPFQTIEAAKSAVESGIVVFWQNAGYQLKKDSDGDWVICSFNGFQSLFKSGKAEDFYAELE